MNDSVGRDYKLPANKVKLTKAKLHTDTHMHTYTDTESAQMTQVRESQLQEKPEPMYLKMGAEMRPQLRLTDSHTPRIHPVTWALPCL